MSAAQADIGGGKGVGLAQQPHGDILRGPFADSGQRAQSRLHLVRRARRREQYGDRRRRPPAIFFRLSARARGMPQRRERSASANAAGSGKTKVRPGSAQRSLSPNFCVSRAGQPGGAGDRHLLAEDRAHRQLEPVPRPRQAQAGPFDHERRQRPVLAQIERDGLWIGGEVEHPPQPRDDIGQGREFWKTHARPEAHRPPTAATETVPCSPCSAMVRR